MQCCVYPLKIRGEWQVPRFVPNFSWEVVKWWSAVSQSTSPICAGASLCLCKKRSPVGTRCDHSAPLTSGLSPRGDPSIGGHPSSQRWGEREGYPCHLWKTCVAMRRSCPWPPLVLFLRSVPSLALSLVACSPAALDASQARFSSESSSAVSLWGIAKDHWIPTKTEQQYVTMGANVTSSVCVSGYVTI